MDLDKPVTRKDFLRIVGLGTFTLFSSIATGISLSSCSMDSESGLKLIRTSNATPEREPDVVINLKSTPGEVQLFLGKATKAWVYQGEVLKGDPTSLQPLSDTYLGPILRFKSGQKIRIHFTNQLPEKSIIHWHGLHVPPEMDGHPKNAISSGETFTYEFQIADRAGTYWFHPHPHGRTGPQVYYGMAGLMLISDNEESALGLPSGEFDIPLIIQDRTFTADNQFDYLPRGRMDRMVGFLGDQILVNGQTNFELSVAGRSYRLRLLNASNSRIYKLAWEDGSPLTVIASDGGLLEIPEQRDYVTLGPAERVELWVDFKRWAVGSTVLLQSLPFSGIGVSGMMVNSETTPNGAKLDVMKVHVGPATSEGERLPDRLSKINWYKPGEAVNQDQPREFTLEMRGMMPTINGRTFDMQAVAKDEIVKLNDIEVWEFSNRSVGDNMRGGGMMRGMNMPHPMHIHGLQFQVIDRQVEPEAIAGWESVRYGYVDHGWKDTVLVMPGERVKILLKFEDFTGLYLYHCHNLEHEDLGMMRNYRVDP
jgi:blue copper oxidase